MSTETRLMELLVEWEQRRAGGGDPTAADLCPDAPDLQAELARRIARRRRLAALMDSPAGGDTPPGYEILGVLGRGGMGVVYRARQASLNREVALKTASAGAGDPAVLAARLRTEAEAAARLSHPNIVPVYDLGATAAGVFIAMECVPGGTLEDRLRDGPPFPPREAARLVATLARAVHFAHTRQVVHRDLKPSNVLFAADGTPKVADFGIAKLLDRDGELTVPGEPIGSTDYMAPEQAAGHLATVGPATDTYALGVILYRLLTGEKPFPPGPRYETLSRILFAPPRRPREVRPDVPAHLEAVCLRCLEKEPGRRFSSAAALADALDPGGAVVQPPPVSRRWAAWAAGAAVAAGVAVAAVVWWPRGATPLPSTAATDPEPAPTAVHLTLRNRVVTGLGDPGVRGLAVHPNGRQAFVAAHALARSGVWDLATGEMVSGPALKGRGAFAQFSADGRFLAASDNDDAVGLWRTDGWERVRPAGRSVLGLGFAAGEPFSDPPAAGREVLLAAEEYTGNLSVLDPASGRVFAQVPLGVSAPHLLAVARDGRRAITLPECSTPVLFQAGGVRAKVWDLTDPTGMRAGRPTAEYVVDRPPACLGIDPAGRRAYVGDRHVDGGQPTAGLTAWDPATGERLWRWESDFETVAAVAPSPNGHWLAVGLVGNGGGDDLVLLAAATGHVRFRTHLGELGTGAVAFTPDGRLLVAGGVDGVLRAWDVREE